MINISPFENYLTFASEFFYSISTGISFSFDQIPM